MNTDLRDSHDSTSLLASGLSSKDNGHDFSPLRYLGSLPLHASDRLSTGLAAKPAPGCGGGAAKRASELVQLDLFEYPA